jgi:tight adherence protein C
VLIAFLSLLLLGLAVSLLSRAFVMRRFRVVDTLDQIDGYGYEARALTASVAESESWLMALVDRLAVRAAGMFGRRFSGDEEPDLRLRLIAAGLYRTTPGKFLGYRILCVIGVPGLWLWLAALLGYSGTIVFLGTAATVALGWQLPMIILRRKAARRLDEIDLALPELIDLLVVTVEAGLGFTGSLQMATSHFDGPLGDELRLTLQEQRMGLSTTESLQNMLMRANTPGMGSFVRSIIQGQLLGVSIGQVMRELAVEMRKRRRQKAQERAQRAPIKMLFPLVFLIFPAIFVVLLAPAIFNFLEAFK